MDSSRFDAVVRSFAAALSRRRALAGLAALIGSGSGFVAEAKRKRHGAPKTRGPGLTAEARKKKKKKKKKTPGVGCGGGAACRDGRTCCAGACTNVQTDNANCGRCGNVCAAGTRCCAGACVTPAWGNRTTFGSAGTDPNQFRDPRAVAVAPDGQTAWVADQFNQRVAVWTRTGPTTWANLTTFGSGPGSDANQFSSPLGVAVTPDGQTVWVAEQNNHRFSVWTKSGPTTWANQGTFGSGPGSDASQFNVPQGVAVSADGQTAWIAELANNRVSVWTKTGATTWANLTTFGSSGSEPSQFDEPFGVAVSADGQTAWVADRGNHRVSIWTKSGPTTWANVTTFGGGPGTGASQFNEPSRVAVTPDEQTVWVADTQNDRVSVWTKTGATTWANLTTFGSNGSEPSQFNLTMGVAVAPDGQTVWVADYGNDRVSVWETSCPA
jgi:DNA-binding beta-propeller fold protein YncE